MPARELTLRRFPFIALILLTSKAASDVVGAIEEAIADNEIPYLRVRSASPDTLTLVYRNRSIPVPPVAVVIRAVASARGANVYVHVASGWLWPVIIIASLAVTIAGFALSYLWREFLVFPWIASGLFLLAVEHVESVGSYVTTVLSQSLPE